MRPTLTRIAIRVLTAGELDRWFDALSSIGARNVERSASADYPAIFFEDPGGTKLELCARHPEK